MNAYFRFLCQWHGLIVCFCVLVLGGISLGALKLQFTTNYRVFFSEDNPQLQAYLTMQQMYNKKDNVLFVLRDKRGHVFSRETLAAVKELTAAAWQMHDAVRVDSLTNFQYSQADSDTILVHPLVENTSELNSAALDKIRSIALNDPQLVGRLINEQADVTGINVTFDIEAEEALDAIPLIAMQAKQLATVTQQKYPHLVIDLTGIVMMDHALTEIPMQDMSRLVPLMFVIISVILVLFFANINIVFVTLSVLFLSIGASMGLAGWFGLLLSPPTAVVPIIIMTVAVADCVHILVNYQNSLAAGNDRNTALLSSLKLNMQAITLTSITTIIGFLGLNYSDVPPFRELGNLVALGALIAFILSLSFLPALLLLLPEQKKNISVRGQLLMNKIGGFVVQKRKMVLIVAMLLAGFFISFLGRNQLNDQFVNYFDHSVDFRRATDETIKRLTGLYVLEFEIDAIEASGITEPENLQLISAFSQWLRLQKEVIHVDNITDILKRINKNLFADDAQHYQLPDSRELAAQELLLYELSLPYGLDLSDKLNSDKSATRLSVSLDNLSSGEVLSLVERTKQWFKIHKTASTSLTVSGAPLMFAHISQRNIIAMLTGTALALVGISLILLIVFKSIKIGLLSLIPNLAPAALAFGLWGLMVGQIGMTLAVVSCMTLGIVVDDTVHFLTKYLQLRRRQNLKSSDALQRAFSSVGSALLITSCALMSGFLVLSFSSFVPNAEMGLLASFTIAFALLADFFILPPLLLLSKA